MAMLKRRRPQDARIRLIRELVSGTNSAYKNPGDAARARRQVISLGMQNTGFAAGGAGAPTPPTPPGNQNTPSPPPRPSPYSAGIKRAQSGAMSFVRGGLALAGISSIAGMAGSAVDSATEESVTFDSIKRRMGDLGVSFDTLRDSTRDAAAGLGITFVQAAQLAEQFAKVTGKLDSDGFSGSLRTSMGFARSFGIDPGGSTQFFGTMSKLGVSSGDQDSKKLALEIATAIEKGGYTAKAEEVLRAISDFASQAARITLTTPNIAGYAGMLAGLTGTGASGLDPAGAASMLAAADAAIRKGGGMGEASMNFSYAALSRGASDVSNPFQAQALWEGGMFGTTSQMFGPNSPIGQFMGPGGVPGLDNTTTFVKEKALLEQQYGGNKWMELDAAKNHFGLASMSQAAALMSANPADLSGAEGLLGPAGLKMSDLSATGIQGLAGIAGAKNFGDLSKIYSGQMARTDLSDSDKDGIRKASATGDFDTLRNALVQLVATRDQEKTDGSETRESIADLKDAITAVGKELLDPLNLIRDGIVKMAGLDTDADKAKEKAAQEGTSDVDIYGSEENAKAWNWGGRGKPGPFSMSDDEKSAIDKATGGDKTKDSIMGALVGWENRGYGKPNNDAKSKAGALGAFQFMPGTWKDFGEGDFSNARNFDKSATAASKMVDWIKKKYNTSDPDVIAAYYDGGDPAARSVLAGKPPPTQETRDYIAGINGILGSTPLPAGHLNGTAEKARAAGVNIGITGEVNLPVKQGGEDVGSATLKPFMQATPAGSYGPGGGL